MKKGFTQVELMIVICIITLFVTFSWAVHNDGKKDGIKQTRIEAVKVGVARWTVINEKGDTEFRWNSPDALPSRIEYAAPKSPDVSTNGYILRLKDATTGKEIEVLIPVYSNVTQLLWSDLSGTRYLSEMGNTNGYRK